MTDNESKRIKETEINDYETEVPNGCDSVGTDCPNDDDLDEMMQCEYDDAYGIVDAYFPEDEMIDDDIMPYDDDPDYFDEVFDDFNEYDMPESY